jgi:hypothetical protein
VYISVIIALAILTMIPVSSVYAGGPRLDWFDDSSEKGKDCWVEGWDSGFAGKYDKERADECANEKYDEYNKAWDGACYEK